MIVRGLPRFRLSIEIHPQFIFERPGDAVRKNRFNFFRKMAAKAWRRYGHILWQTAKSSPTDGKRQAKANTKEFVNEQTLINQPCQQPRTLNEPETERRRR